jgi:putative colanic acid biosynthesis acetyltransferase WcaB
MSLIEKIKIDLKANSGNSKGKLIVTAYRISNYISQSSNILIRVVGWPFVKGYNFFFPWFMAVEIPDSVKIGAGLKVWHGMALVINSNVRIGDNVLLRHSTTIGNKCEGSGCPVIGDNVDIGAHCIIIGDITIGSNVIIGAGSIVTKTVPENTKVYGNPLKFLPI